MKRTITRTGSRLALAFATLLVVCGNVHADIVISISFDQNSLVSSQTIQAGTATTTAYLFFEATDGPNTNDVGGNFDGFDYAIEVLNSSGAIESFFKPITTANLNAQMQTPAQMWSVVDSSGDGALNQLAGNATAPAGAGLSIPFGFGIAALEFTLDTSQLVVDDVLTFDPNLFGLAEVSLAGTAFESTFNNAQLTVVDAVPEPTGAVMFLALGICGVCRRNRI